MAITASYQAPLELIGSSVARGLARAGRDRHGRGGSAGSPVRSARTARAWPTARSITATTASPSPSCGSGIGRGSTAGRGGRRPARAGDRAVPGRGRGAARRARRDRDARLVVDHLRRGPDAGRRAGGGGVRHGPGRRRGPRGRRQLHRSRGTRPASSGPRRPPAASRSWSTPTAGRAGMRSTVAGSVEPAFRVEDVQQWVDDGARLIGGCCRVGPAQIAALAEQVRCAAPPRH